MKWRLPQEEGRTIRGFRAPRPVATLWVRTRFGTFASFQFLVDSGADCTSLPLPFAQREGIAVSRNEASRIAVGGLLGSAGGYRGAIQVRIGQVDFEWPCDFLQVPLPPPTRPPGVLGRAGFLDAFTICLNDNFLTIQRRPRSWRQRLAQLLWPFARHQALEEPL
jgi:hypothetical protein